MGDDFGNVYADEERAESYAGLEYPATYYLAFRDIPELIRTHVTGDRALDFGCGTGRSTRFLKELGFDATGVDIAPEMLARARERDPQGTYHLVADDDLGAVADLSFDVILAAFTFDNVPMERKTTLFRALAHRLATGGRIVSLVSATDIYLNEWASFSTKDFPENRSAQSGDTVRIIMLDVDDRRPVEDVLCSDAAYQEIFQAAGLQSLQLHAPLGREDEPYRWVSETRVSPWSIYVLARSE